MTAISRLRSGASLMKEILRAADQSHDANGRVSSGELKSMLDGEGYRRGSMATATTRTHRYAQKLSGQPSPKVSATDAAVDRTLRAIKKAAASDGDARSLSSFEYDKLSDTAKAFVRFSNRYGDSSFDELFF